MRKHAGFASIPIWFVAVMAAILATIAVPIFAAAGDNKTDAGTAGPYQETLLNGGEQL